LLELEMVLDELLGEHVVGAHNKLHRLHAWRRGLGARPGPSS
jgi:hypothetical protein